MLDMFYTKTEPSIQFTRLLSKETLYGIREENQMTIL